MSEEERLRRAEEVAYRRQNRIPADNINIGNKEKVKLSKFGKFFIQVIVSICVFGAIYFVNENYSFALENIKPIMNEDTNFNEIYETFNSVVKDMIKESGDNTLNEENSISEENITSENRMKEIANSEDNVVNENMVENNEVQSKNNNENKNTETSNENKQENVDDVSYIKNNFSFIRPVDGGYISSTFGTRTPTDIISENHQGVDIAINSGTNVKASMNGKVKEVSNYGDYGLYIVIENNDVQTLYAHLSEVYVSQGNEVSQGQVIAKSGSTGKSTGPHLHFEIRRNNCPIDPQKILEL